MPIGEFNNFYEIWGPKYIEGKLMEHVADRDRYVAIALAKKPVDGVQSLLSLSKNEVFIEVRKKQPSNIRGFPKKYFLRAVDEDTARGKIVKIREILVEDNETDQHMIDWRKERIDSIDDVLTTDK